VNEEFRTDYEVGETKKKLVEFLNHKEVEPYFVSRPGRMIKREQDFSDARGNLFRMDRVVIDEGNISVIDYKTGDREAEREYSSQLKNYINILKAIFPGKNIVQGIIAYVDLKEIRRIM
jgi:ATP-dependent exoDNAse (exonuclease V) beta subunit